MKSLLAKLKLTLILALVIITALFYINNQHTMVSLNLSPVAQSIRVDVSLLIVGAFSAGVVSTWLVMILQSLIKRLSQRGKALPPAEPAADN